jgi:hypothetical protein
LVEANVSEKRAVTICRAEVMSRANQPTKKLTKGRVKRRHETSTLARFDQSCIRNAFLEVVNVATNYNGGAAYANRVLLWPKALICDIRGYCYWWEIIPSGNLLWEGFWLGGFLGVGPRSVGIALAEGLHD